jgi:hypothetical protein
MQMHPYLFFGLGSRFWTAYRISSGIAYSETWLSGKSSIPLAGAKFETNGTVLPFGHITIRSGGESLQLRRVKKKSSVLDALDRSRLGLSEIDSSSSISKALESTLIEGSDEAVKLVNDLSSLDASIAHTEKEVSDRRREARTFGPFSIPTWFLEEEIFVPAIVGGLACGFLLNGIAKYFDLGSLRSIAETLVIISMAAFPTIFATVMVSAFLLNLRAKQPSILARIKEKASECERMHEKRTGLLHRITALRRQSRAA